MAWLGLGVVTTWPLLAQVEVAPLDDAALQAAIDSAADADALDHLVEECSTSNDEHRVTVTSHYGQIAMAVAGRRRQNLPLPDLGEMNQAIREPILSLWVEAVRPSSGSDDTVDTSPTISRVLIRPEGRPGGAVDPVAFKTESVPVRNLLGAESVSNRALATFSANTALQAAASRDLEVVVVTPDGERRCDVNNDRIYRMFYLERP